MATTNTPKTPKIFQCIKCNFKCFNKKDYNRHLQTAKHNFQQNQREKPKKTPSNCDFTCACGKKYKERSGLWRHKKKCNHQNSLTIVEEKEREPTDNSTILGLIAQNKELMNLLVVQNQEHREETSKLHNTIKEMIPKIGNNNNNTTNNNQFNLQVFLNEDCKDAINFSDFIKQIQVSFEDIENQAESGYVKGISKLFIENLKELGTNKRPIHCTDKKRKTLYIKENDEWDKEGSQDTLKNGIQEITRSTMRTLIKEKENQAEEFADMESDFSKKCLVIQRNLIPTAPRETAFSKVMENITKNSGIIE
jgi:hypothetical protein